jgi:protease I
MDGCDKNAANLRNETSPLMSRVLMPLPTHDFDPTESGVPWQVLTNAGHEVIFATPSAQLARADARMVTGHGLGPLKPFLAADRNGRLAYLAMQASPAFRAPLAYAQLRAEDYDAMLLPGGHAPGMREYLESHVLQGLVSSMFAHDKPVGAICHGVVLVVRSLGANGNSVLHGRQTTALLKSQEMLAFNLTRAWLGDYYRTYPQTVQDEICEALASPDDFITGPLPLRRDTPTRLASGYVHRDGNYLSARWPGDAHRFANEFRELLAGRH